MQKKKTNQSHKTSTKKILVKLCVAIGKFTSRYYHLCISNYYCTTIRLLLYYSYLLYSRTDIVQSSYNRKFSDSLWSTKNYASIRDQQATKKRSRLSTSLYSYLFVRLVYHDAEQEKRKAKKHHYQEAFRHRIQEYLTTQTLSVVEVLAREEQLEYLFFVFHIANISQSSVL